MIKIKRIKIKIKILEGNLMQIYVKNISWIS